MIVITTLLASLLGICIGILVQQSVYSLLIALVVPGIFWMVKRPTTHRNIDAIHSSSVPISIFKSELDDISFSDDAKSSTKKKTVSMSFGYIAGILSGNLFSTIMISTAL